MQDKFYKWFLYMIVAGVALEQIFDIIGGLEAFYHLILCCAVLFVCYGMVHCLRNGEKDENKNGKNKME